jgi:hypothetical protein
MKSPKSRTGPPTNPDGAFRNPPSASSAAVTGGAFATEEDVGTEGAGTEPRASTQAERKAGSSSKRTRRGKGAI